MCLLRYVIHRLTIKKTDFLMKSVFSCTFSPKFAAKVFGDGEYLGNTESRLFSDYHR